MFQNADPIILFRMFERLTLTATVILVAVVVMIGFWRSVQKIDLAQGGSLGIAGSFVFSTPVFALLTIVGYAYVSLSHPIKVDTPAAGTGIAPAEQVASANGGETRFLGASVDAAVSPEDMAYERTIAQRRIRSLNCLAEGQTLSPRLEDDLADTRLALMAPVWDEAWGGYDPFSAWTRGEVAEAPNAAAAAFYNDRHLAC